MTTNKMTYVNALTYAIENIEDAEVVQKLTALRESLSKRATSARKPSAEQQHNDAIRGEIVAMLAESEGMTITEIANALISAHEGEQFSNQRVNQLVVKMIKDGTVERFEVKRKAYFRLATAE